jgi:hypothetical protein
MRTWGNLAHQIDTRGDPRPHQGAGCGKRGQGMNWKIQYHRPWAAESVGSAAGKMSKPVKAEIFLWDREPAVDYTYANGDRGEHRIGMDDWPILLQLERAGKLTFRDDDIRERFQRMKPSSPWLIFNAVACNPLTLLKHQCPLHFLCLLPG